MATRNSITNDEIKSKALSKAGRDNWDNIFAKKSAHEWLKETPELRVLDPDGWRYDDGVTMDTPISKSEFNKRLQQCTCLGWVNPESVQKVTIIP